jgi:hypothetical protein
VRAGFDAIHTQGAIDVADLLGHVKIEFAATLMAIPSDAVMGCACGAYALAPGDQLERRDERADEVELPNGANVLAETRAAEQSVHQEGRNKVGEQYSGSTLRHIPDRPFLIRPEKDKHERGADPLPAQRYRPFPAGCLEQTCQLPRQHKRTRHAEEVSCEEKREHSKYTDHIPGDYSGEIHRSHLMTEEAMRYHQSSYGQTNRL